MLYFGLAVIFITVFFDALRDGWKGESWWKRHIVKWIQFFMPIFFILWVIKLNINELIIVSLASWFIWQFVIQVICDKDWESMWIKLFKWIDKKLHEIGK